RYKSTLSIRHARSRQQNPFWRFGDRKPSFQKTSERTSMFVQLTKEFLGKSIGERIDVADADADQLIRHGWAQPVQDDVLTPTIARAVQGGLDDAVERAMQSWLRKQAASKPGGRLPFAGLGDAALDDPRGGFKHFG